ncbi:unnamed protein product [Cuscuta europaea]|uniref:C3H1-type domain-containing protein n=1 Tax=Cuscuta europaea TaxID=41803 RepID=A0A9P0YIA0_CUSEU|nr:unnamed protein product [Cuscuta europaea]
MENLYSGHNEPKTPTVKYFDGNAMPLSIGRAHFDVPIPLSPVFDPYFSSESPNTPNSMSLFYRRSGSCVPFDLSVGNDGGGRAGGFRSPLASIENRVTQPSRSPVTMFKTPVKIEEDVIVMDGILVKPKVGSTRSRLSQTPSDSGDKNSFYKRDKCLFWEDSGSCRLGSKCQFAHGQEELRQARLTTKSNRNEICKLSNMGACSYAIKCNYFHLQEPDKEPEESEKEPEKEVIPAVLSPAAGAKVDIPVTPTESKQPANGGQSSTLTTGSSAAQTSGNTGWSPHDDGINISLPAKAPIEEDADAYIQRVLYGPSGERLPVFEKICPK